MVSKDPEIIRKGLLEMGLESKVDFILGLKPGDFALVEHNGKQIKARVDAIPMYWSKEYQRALGLTVMDPVLAGAQTGYVLVDFRLMHLEPDKDYSPCFVTGVPADQVHPYEG